MENNTNQNRSWDDNNHSNAGFDSTAPRNHNNSWSSQPYKEKLPADNTAMVLAIIATVVSILCCCFFGSFVGVILSVIGFIMANSSINQYKQSPEKYDASSYRRVNSAKIFNLVILIISALLSIVMITGIADDFTNKYDYLNNDYDEYEEEYDYEEEPTDTWYYEEEDSSNTADEDIIIEETPAQEVPTEEVPTEEIPEAAAAFEDEQ